MGDLEGLAFFWSTNVVRKGRRLNIPGQAFRALMYMGKFGGPTPKRHILWSNDQGLLDGVLEHGGRMTRAEMQACQGPPLVKKHVDKLGIQRRTGIKQNLKNSQQLVTHYVKQSWSSFLKLDVVILYGF